MAGQVTPQVITSAAGLRSVSPRDVARHVTLDILSAIQSFGGGAPTIESPRVQFLLLHHVMGDEARKFRRFMSYATSRWRGVDYSAAVERIVLGRVEDCLLSVTFDDGLKCCLRAAQILEEFGWRGCFFVCPDMVGQRNPATIERFCRERLRHGPVEFMDWDDLEQLRAAGHEIGGHTLGHVDLGRVSISEAQEQIGGCYDVLRRRLGEVRHFAWPYGQFQHIQPAAVDAVFAAGFVSCASGVRGCHPGGLGPIDFRSLCLRRDSIEATWPLAHVAYFLQRAQRRADAHAGRWPWAPAAA